MGTVSLPINTHKILNNSLFSVECSNKNIIKKSNIIDHIELYME